MNDRSRDLTRRAAVCAVVAAAMAFQGCASGTRGVDSSLVPRGWPVPWDEAVVTSDFDAPRGTSRHQGLDLSVPAGTPVRTTADGRVSFAGRSGDFGRLVVIEHGTGYQTRYAHLKSIEVKEGEKVPRGKIIGRVGKSGNATGYHLHYEVRRSGRPVDPRSFLSMLDSEDESPSYPAQ